MIELCGLSTIMEPTLIRGLFSVACPFDLPPIMGKMIIKENDLTKEYKIHYENRSGLYEHLIVHLKCENFDPNKNSNLQLSKINGELNLLNELEIIENK